MPHFPEERFDLRYVCRDQVKGKVAESDYVGGTQGAKFFPKKCHVFGEVGWDSGFQGTRSASGFVKIREMSIRDSDAGKKIIKGTSIRI